MTLAYPARTSEASNPVTGALNVAVIGIGALVRLGAAEVRSTVKGSGRKCSRNCAPVPGLPAKPLIDINLVVADTTDEDAYVPPLEALGYELRVREPDWFQHRMLRGCDPPVNLHVFPPGCEEVPRMLAFRDHLRTNEADRELYARAKRELAAKEWKYVQNYADAKTAVVQEILSRTE